MTVKTGRRWARRAALIAALAAVAELAASVQGSGGQRDPAIYAQAGDGYALAPGFDGQLWTGLRAVQISIGADGHRSVNCADVAPPQPGAVPIHVVGDSQVFGWGLSDCETIPAQLQRLIGPGYRVINHGVPGYGPNQYETVVNSLPKGELAIVTFTAQNDLWDLYQRQTLTPVICGRLLAPDSWFAALPCALLSSLALQGAVRQVKETPYAVLPIQRNAYARAARAVLTSRLTGSYERLAARGNVRFAFIPWELDSDPMRREKYPAAEDQILDTQEPFNDECGSRAALMAQPAMYLANDTHLSPAGAATMAECLRKLVQPARMAKGTAPSAEVTQPVSTGLVFPVLQ